MAGESPAARTQTPVAIIGTGCRAPGGITSASELWQVLLDRRDVVTGSDPGTRWPEEERVTPADLAGSGMLRSGSFLDDVDLFDPGFFGVPAQEAGSVDPQHRLLMETTWEALEDAGVPPRSLAGSRTGMFVGISGADYAKRFTLAEFNIYHGISAIPSGAPGRISYILDVNGPSLAVDGACASSLIAVHLACRSLHDGETDLALAGGVTVQLEWGGLIGFARAGALSTRGRCASFDESADGFVRGEGCGMIALKRLADAQRDGDRVLAVIAGTAINHAGRVQGVTQPSRSAQREVMTSAMRAAGVAPGDIGYVESHGTGTPVGDPIEFGALSDVHSSSTAPCALGALKTNIGHPESAAGVLGLIKAAFAVRHGVIPANLHFTRWNPEIEAEGTRFFVPTQTTAWEADGGPRRAAVSAFGVTGSNAHAIVEEAPAAPARENRRIRERALVHAVSAASPGGLAATAGRLAEHLESTRPQPEDVARTLAVHRSHLTTRACVLAQDRAGLGDGLCALAEGREHPAVVRGATGDPGMPVWVFSGHGSQWPGMARDLLGEDPAFTRMVDRLDAVAGQDGVPVRRLIETGAHLERMDVVQPVVFAVQTALAEMWRAWGLRPAAVVGHSMGEAAAAVAAGILSPEDGMRITLARSSLLQRVAGGCMATVALPVEQVEQEIAGLDGVSVAVVTAPASTVVAGHQHVVDELLRRWQDRGVFGKRLAVVVAAHSPQVDPILADIAARTSWLAGATPEVPFYSTAGDPREPVVFDSAYWARNLRAPVRFDLASRALVEDGYRVFLELSPHPLLTHAVEETASALRTGVTTVPSLVRDRPGREALCRAAATLHVTGVPVDLGAVNGDGTRVPLPPTAFDRSRYWLENKRGTHGAGNHLWLGERAVVPDSDAEDRTRHVWSADLGADRIEWLEQHTLRGTPLVPGAAYVELVLAAATELLGCALDEVCLTGVRFDRMLPLAGSVPLQVAATRTGLRAEVEILQHSGGGWDRVAAATATRCEEAADARPGLPVPEHTRTPDELYEGFRRIGLDTGPAFHSIAAVTDDGIARLLVPLEAPILSGAPKVHPVLLDGCVLSVAALLLSEQDFVTENVDAPWLPARIAEVVLPGDPTRIAWVRPEVHRDGPHSATGRADLHDEDGVWIGALEGVELVRSTSVSPAQALMNSRLFEISWQPQPLPAATGPVDAGEWVLVAEPGDGTAGRLAAALAELGGRPVVREDVPLDETGANVVWCATGELDELDRVTRLATLVRESAHRPAPPRIWVLSGNARPVLDGDPVVPGVCAVRGLLRVASIEQPESAVTWIDTDDTEADVHELAAELLAGSPETEVAWRSGQRYVARMTRAPLAHRPPRTAGERDVVAGADEYVLEADADGGLERVRMIATGEPLPVPGPGQLLVRSEAVTVHFRDVLIALGIYPTDDGSVPRLGSDVGGVVLAVGEGVGEFREGDRVVSVVPDGTGTMTSAALVAADLTVRLPDGLPMLETTASVLTYLTAWHALHDLARLHEGETVLVHSAAGGTGLAAIEVARLLGATVIGTAGTEAKRRYLREHGVAHVFDSRTLDFADQVREVTGGRGVDVVLNSLTGAAMRASLDLLAPTGRFVEIGKRDLYDGARIGLDAFRHGITYAALDLVLTATEQRAVFRAALHKVITELEAARLPLLPSSVVPLPEAVEAFKQLASGEHIGRLVLEFPPKGHRLRVHAPNREDVVRPGGAYIVTGGTRGLGLEAIRWLAAHGAGRVVVGGRGELSPEATEIVRATTEAGCVVEVVRGDITEPDTARRLVAAAGEDLRGILHTAVVLDDTPISGLTAAKLERVWHPKVTGLRNLHEASEGHALDWFVVFSSMSAMLGNAGQANYAAAGAWVDAFAKWRHDQGRPALSVDWGAWGEAGRATHFAARGFDTITTADGFATLEALIRHQRVNTGVFDYQPDTLFHAFPHAAENPLLAELDSGTANAGEEAPAFKVHAEKPGPARTQLVQDAVVHILAALLGTQPAAVPAHAKFTDLGLDSLLAVALTRRLQADLDLALTAADVWAHPSPAELAAHLDSTIGG
ncbi:type I polyketide synthase [Amycolatopsis magusensis]|uniref:Acyl transferase domain-containing protein/NADPH:quinone reductase-like Zn-dependent oxidoreductase/acyl carrier protein n=1 Tax=Amycolatopsis magusensis TaxID=882444 RepID=A0ABS4Q1V1_9PSEU|nr:type I polyketide synthase [Amycolatopsis magusensis]MBP2185662.1 acyl transferase domain-containing protein/NADPH:quinone reductase-like Zn-dependent oxidoreductase/acyl carrier protein [Amycolatopsis magusensis]